MTKLQIIGIGWAADALAGMPQLAGSPYENSNFCALIQTPSCVYRIQKNFDTAKKASYWHQKYTEPQWQIVPNLATHKLGMLVLLNESSSWRDLLWLVHILKMERQDVSTLLLKPYLRTQGNWDALLSLMEMFPPTLLIARGRGYNLYVDTPLPDRRDKPFPLDYSLLYFFYIHIQRIERSEPMFPIQLKMSMQTHEMPTIVSKKLKFPRKKKKSVEEELKDCGIIVRRL